MSYIKNPSSIEEKSFKIIQSVIDEEHAGYTFNTEMEESIIKRAIHTSGDFDYLYNLRFTHDVVNKIVDVLVQGGTIFTDSTITLNGINKRVLDQMGVKYKCLIDDEDVIKLAEEKGITRSMAAVEYAVKEEGPKIFAFGGAPSALLRLLEMIEHKEAEVDAIIGVPVGFIGIEECKQVLFESDVPAIVTLGRKGGSTIVVGIINAIIYQLKHVATDDYIRYSTPTQK
ncbi:MULTISPECIES: cobalt-precorrin-8 methylmutase [unclassified Granulicatella]|uniref:cobalt-precorrin-8 methylmutase n=1 Tax=unclassified Granulicatella TaxID=2630493 RepID=UPI0010747810|nr:MULTISPECIES: cobalt-precorrin-8 methylmutase [unclassified Granulicatella]MBF0779511.1 cobalt-precorrin-8 methylmutase [Granulicatella sp. 19428wC4_WM01]TFU96477.1 cobalt-precorrin-8 methylmutase [Granulicatella sp. WM01]